MSKPSLSPRVAVLLLTRAGIVSILRSLNGNGDTPPAGSMTQEYTIGDFVHEVEVRSTRGLPYGLDWDICGAIETLFFQAGCPDDNRLRVTPRMLLSAAGLDDSGRYYVLLRESLMRLEGVRWTLRRSIKGSEDGETTSTGFISQMTVWDRSLGRTKKLIPEALVEIYLTPNFADLIRAGLHQLLDVDLLNSLGQPTARSLYRVLEGHRVKLDGTLAMDMTVRLEDWMAACGIPNQYRSNARVTLDRAHTHLKKAGYLREAVFNGRGVDATLWYSFSGVVADPKLVELLTAYGVARPVAEGLASQHPDRIRDVLGAVQARLDEGYKPSSVAAMVVDAVRHPAKYGGVEARVMRRGPGRPPGTKAIQASLEKPGQQTLLEEPEMTDESRRQLIVAMVRLRLQREINAQEREALQRLSGEKLRDITATLTKNSNKLTAQAFLELLTV